MSLLAPKTPPPCKCGTKLFPKMADEYPVDPNRLKPWESMPSASFGADASASAPSDGSSWYGSPLRFFATVGLSMGIGYVLGTRK